LIESCTNRSIMLIFANIQPRFKLKWLYLLKQSLVTHSRSCLKQSFSHSSAHLSIHPKEGIKTNQLTNFIYRCQKWSDHGSNDIKSNCSVVAFNKGKKVSKILSLFEKIRYNFNYKELLLSLIQKCFDEIIFDQVLQFPL
jgi:hypothetical protein